MMKTKEFIKKVAELGYKINEKNFFDSVICLIISNSFDRKVGYVAKNKLFEMNIRSDENMTEELFDLIVEYANTPVKDREEEKRYYLRHKWLNNKNTNYLHLNEENNFYDLSVYKSLEAWKAQLQFTEKEIEEIKEKFDTGLSDFELVEVEE